MHPLPLLVLTKVKRRLMAGVIVLVGISASGNLYSFDRYHALEIGKMSLECATRPDSLRLYHSTDCLGPTLGMNSTAVWANEHGLCEQRRH